MINFSFYKTKNNTKISLVLFFVKIKIYDRFFDSCDDLILSGCSS